MKLTLTKEHKEKQRGYQDNQSCLIAVALREIFPKAKIGVGGYDVWVDGVCHTFGDGTQESNRTQSEIIVAAYPTLARQQGLEPTEFPFTIDIPTLKMPELTK